MPQLIHDLKNVNSRARISVKLVAEVGVGSGRAGIDGAAGGLGDGRIGGSIIAMMDGVGLMVKDVGAAIGEAAVMAAIGDGAVCTINALPAGAPLRVSDFPLDLLGKVLAHAILALGIDLIWFGVLVVKYLEIGLLTPPVGLNVYIVKSVVGRDIELETIFRGVGWFLGCEVIVVLLLATVPEISLFLPNLMK